MSTTYIIAPTKNIVDLIHYKGIINNKIINLNSKLYNENDQLDVTKANSYIYNAFNEEEAVIDKTLEKNISYVNLSSLFEYGTAKFDKKINLNKFSMYQLYFQYLGEGSQY